MLTSDDKIEIAKIVDARMKASRHENSDHLDNALLPKKITPSTAGGQCLVSVSGSVVWATREIGYAIATGNFATSGATYENITDLTMTIDTDVYPEFFLEAFVPVTRATAGAGLHSLSINDGSGNVTYSYVTIGATNYYGQMYAAEKIASGTYTGSKTFTAQVKTFTGACSPAAGAGSIIRATLI